MKENKGGKPALTAKQTRFVAAFSGNGTRAAREAGYIGDNDQLASTASTLLKIPKVRAAISTRNGSKLGAAIMTRQQRQEWWSRVMRDESADMTDRLAAARDLGRSEGDFVERDVDDGTATLAVRLQAAIDRVQSHRAAEQEIVNAQIIEPKQLERPQ
jgi:phage terminase small subunit